MIYFVAPFYMICSLILLVFRLPNLHFAVVFSLPILVSAVLPPMASPFLLSKLKPLLHYFDYEEIIEDKPIDVRKSILEEKKNYLCVFQPHGALSYTGIVSLVYNSNPEFMGRLKTAVADAVLITPLVKHVLGIFGLISASKTSMVQTLKKPGVDGSVVLYVGGLAELFLSCEETERLYLKNRKGFIKLALQTGVDIVPVYLFGNTSVLSVYKNKFLVGLSRKLQASLTYIWGKFYLPIPRPNKLLYVSGQPLGLPQIDQPSQSDIDKYHAKYCAEVTRIYNTYRERVPEYKHKNLEIV